MLLACAELNAPVEAPGPAPLISQRSGARAPVLGRGTEQAGLGPVGTVILAEASRGCWERMARRAGLVVVGRGPGL